MADNFLENVIFRPARKEECRNVAELFRIASEGVADYIWSKIAEEGEDILEIGAKRYEDEDSLFCYKNCIIAEIDAEVAGMLVAFPMYVDPEKDFSESDPVLLPYEKLEEDNSYYICAVALFEKYRGKGIGSKFMDIAENKAREDGFNKLSLLVFEKNTGAKRLYERLGYVEVAREPTVPHPLIHYTGDVILMVKYL